MQVHLKYQGLNELEVYGLIYRERRGQGRANRIYVLKGKLFNE